MSNYKRKPVFQEMKEIIASACSPFRKLISCYVKVTLQNIDSRRVNRKSVINFSKDQNFVNKVKTHEGKISC